MPQRRSVVEPVSGHLQDDHTCVAAFLRDSWAKPLNTVLSVPATTLAGRSAGWRASAPGRCGIVGERRRATPNHIVLLPPIAGCRMPKYFAQRQPRTCYWKLNCIPIILMTSLHMSNIIQNQETPLVSVVIPCFNHRKYVGATIESVITQTYNKIELIIIDDGSTDDSISVINSYVSRCESRFVRFELRSRANKGLSATLNEALAWSRGQFWGSIASDDVLLPNKTESQVEYLLAHPEVKAVHGGASLISTTGAILAIRRVPNRIYTFRDIIKNDYLFFTASQLWDLPTIRSIGGYQCGVILEDWYLLLKITAAGHRVAAMDRVFVSYRRHDNNISNNIRFMHAEREKVLKLFNASPEYQDGVTGLFYTKAYELASIDKIEATYNLIKAITRSPSYLISEKTYRIFAKLCIPKTFLQGRLTGRR